MKFRDLEFAEIAAVLIGIALIAGLALFYLEVSSVSCAGFVGDRPRVEDMYGIRKLVCQGGAGSFLWRAGVVTFPFAVTAFAVWKRRGSPASTTLIATPIIAVYFLFALMVELSPRR